MKSVEVSTKTVVISLAVLFVLVAIFGKMQWDKFQEEKEDSLRVHHRYSLRIQVDRS